MTEAAGFVGAIAKWLIGGLAAAAKAQNGAARQSEWAPFGIEQVEVAFNADGAIVVHGDFGWRQFSLPRIRYTIAAKAAGMRLSAPLQHLNISGRMDRPHLTMRGFR